jgi:hypothetical protein
LLISLNFRLRSRQVLIEFFKVIMVVNLFEFILLSDLT